jgi:hypothetical protein
MNTPFSLKYEVFGAKLGFGCEVIIPSPNPAVCGY